MPKSNSKMETNTAFINYKTWKVPQESAKMQNSMMQGLINNNNSHIE